MPSPEFHIQPVVQLLGQTSSPYDVPADPEIFNGNWLEPALAHARSLLQSADRETHALESTTGHGLTHVFLASDQAENYSVHLRMRGEGDAVPRDPAEKAVVLTLGGTMELEAFRHAGDVDEDTPWYVRQFSPESVYACHPGTLHSVQQSDDAVQLVITQGAAGAPGRRLTAAEYREAADRARNLLGRAIEARRESLPSGA
ncbi:hypothetical protein A6A06_01805 [Streptomyces sp. CB02923]|uniref:hypothetical protein n=1 Tax=Streptomyces sp. CB02923 TaxID=1718985 RepID=UPI00093CF390|nr:hypothetical protein [Streptomyces sp. CB02923]OKI09461.1 hypothetical protein A6A06_01805 [Streptomyces sp. CB02923]